PPALHVALPISSPVHRRNDLALRRWPSWDLKPPETHRMRRTLSESSVKPRPTFSRSLPIAVFFDGSRTDQRRQTIEARPTDERPRGGRRHDDVHWERPRRNGRGWTCAVAGRADPDHPRAR